MRRTKLTTTSVFGWLASALFSLAGLVIVWACKWLAKLGKWALLQVFTHPRTSVSLAGVGGLVLLLGWQWVVGIVAVVLLTGSVWKAAHRESFEATVETWLRTWHRKWWTYRRRWQEVMSRCGLVVQDGEDTYVPRLRKVATSTYWDRLLVELQIGQETKDFDQAQGKLQRAFEGERIAIRIPDAKHVGIDIMKADPFRHEVIPAADMPATTADIDFAHIPVGLDEHLEPLTISLVGGHTAGAGATGAGKAGLEWNCLRAVAPAIADGTVKPIFIDPKAKELRQGITLVDAGVFGVKAESDVKPTGDYAVTATDVVALLQRVVDELEKANLAGGENGERDFVPSKATPLRPIFIDELAPLLAYWPRRVRDQIEDLLGIVLTQGRAAGYIVVGLIQEPTKDIFTIRDLFARRIGLRLPTEDHTDAALTDKAADRGADCSNIPESLPGVCFAFHEKDKRAIRGRLGNVRNEDIDELVAYVDELRGKTPIVPADAPDTGEAVLYEVIDEGEAGSMVFDEAA